MDACLREIHGLPYVLKADHLWLKLCLDCMQWVAIIIVPFKLEDSCSPSASCNKQIFNFSADMMIRLINPRSFNSVLMMKKVTELMLN